MKAIILIAMLLGATGVAAAQQSAGPAAKQRHSAAQMPLRLLPARLPRARQPQPMGIPEQYGAPQEAFAGFPERSSAANPAPSACQLRLEKVATFKPLPALAGPGECGATDAVLLGSVLLADQTTVPLTPPATLRCTMAEAVADWVREDVAPAALKFGVAAARRRQLRFIRVSRSQPRARRHAERTRPCQCSRRPRISAGQRQDDRIDRSQCCQGMA